jgi:5-formyltetrahydrofolate cyclo-ligase
MIELHNQGCQLALPVVVAKRQPLVFRAWRPGDPLEAGVFGTLHPSPKREWSSPMR